MLYLNKTDGLEPLPRCLSYGTSSPLTFAKTTEYSSKNAFWYLLPGSWPQFYTDCVIIDCNAEEFSTLPKSKAHFV